MFFKIINQISNEKKAKRIESTHALFKEVFDRATIEGIAADEIKNGLNALFNEGKPESSRPINSKYIKKVE